MIQNDVEVNARHETDLMRHHPSRCSSSPLLSDRGRRCFVGSHRYQQQDVHYTVLYVGVRLLSSLPWDTTNQSCVIAVLSSV